MSIKSISRLLQTCAIPLLFLLMTIPFLVSCSQDRNETLQFWHFQSEPNQKKALDSLLSEFTLQTGIEVETTELSWGDGKTKLIAAFNSSTGPDLLEIGSDWIAQFAAEGIFLPLNDSVFDLSSYLEYTLDASTVYDKVYALPWYIDSRPVMLNRSLLQEFNYPDSLDLTWENLVKVPLVNVEGKHLVGINGPDRHRLYKKILPMIWSNKGKLKSHNEYIFDSPEVIEAINLYKKLSERALVESQKNLDVEFIKGNIAVLNSGSWLLGRMADTDINFDVVPYLSIDGSRPGEAFAGGEYLAISTQSQQKDKAIKLMKFLSDGKNVIRFAKMVPEAGFPAQKAFYNDSSLFNRPWKHIFADQLKNSRMTPSDNRWLDVEEILEEEVENVLYDKKDAAEAMKSAQRRVQNLQNE